MKIIKTKGYSVTKVIKYDDSQKTKDKVFQKIVDFFVEHECFSGEGICQSDGPQIAAPELLSELADDIIKFDVEYKDENIRKPSK